MSASLRITDGYTERVGFKGTKTNASIELTIRPYAGFQGDQEWGKVIAAGLRGEDQTPILIGQILERSDNGKINGKPWPWDEQSLRELRANEFQLIVYAIHGKLLPDFLYTPNPEDPSEYIQAPYPSAEERLGN